MGLQTVLHLQPMLDRTQKNISVRKLCALLVSYQITIRKATQDYQGVRHAQPAVTTPMGQLQSLRDEFNLAYATGPELYVESTCLLSQLVAIDLLLGQPHTGQRVLNGNVRAKNIATNRAGKPGI